MLTLYHAPTSVCSQKVRVGLAIIGLEYDSRVLNLQKGDQFDPDYMRLNRDAVVPTLVDGELVITESSLILEYIDREYNGAALMPAERAAKVAAQSWLLRCLAVHAAINTLSFSTAMRESILASQTPEQIEALAAKFPDPVMGAKRKDLLHNGLGSIYVGQALVHLHRALADMDAALAGAPWLGGETPGISDIALIAYIDRLERLGMAGLWAGFPRITPWLAAWRETPAYHTAIEAHVPAGSAEQMRAGGSKYWPEVQKRWQEISG
ncbi:glutathione S-transferase family protein [Pararhodobacter oceanensis]|uniref:glutathione S-transferase family protein n=1 Tax=Pararhodobacter oceanensis TaxID=2172121 RepID=UPI003A939CC9